MKIIVTGCRGQLGTEIIKQLREGRSELGPIPEKLVSATVIPVDLPELDITNYKMVDDFIRRQRPDVIINCAAFTNVDGCEVNHDTAFKANAIGPRNLAQAATKTGARLVHVSTDYVFSGRENGGIPQDEATIPGPISAYGSTKLMGEKYVEQFCHRHFIVRTAWLYSYYGKNFVKTIVNAGKKFGKLEVVNDQCGNPTNAVDLAHEILQLCVTHEYGLYHCTGPDAPLHRRQRRPRLEGRAGLLLRALGRRQWDEITLSGRFASSSPGGGNNADRRQWRKQGGVVGAAASKTHAKRCGCWEPQPGCEAPLASRAGFAEKCKVPGPAHK